ncbi:Rrf2 family transcriptional regulator [sulfur-oxidizing endosymbiont of Gigantopelta aegis]|uniref:Rrf2 family transcriptional regulator n=1 Tax=sulfur-oxidizing endosymbiont of Gigantopelta aegis TaxID=2794934 RepID=UPI0018DBD56A|nr:Rrf2 family transcriptional regulator [sulfur-oxidizing endosymbiont of Gigantopelta aegis]
MQLTQKTEFALRILIYLSLQDKQKLSNITEISDCFSLSRNHIVKIVHELGKLDFIKTTRGKGGGLQLNHHCHDIRLGDVVRKMESNLDIVDCEKPACPIVPICRLKGILHQARDAFLAQLDLFTLEDLKQQPEQLLQLLHHVN